MLSFLKTLIKSSALVFVIKKILWQQLFVTASGRKHWPRKFVRNEISLALAEKNNTIAHTSYWSQVIGWTNCNDSKNDFLARPKFVSSLAAVASSSMAPIPSVTSIDARPATDCCRTLAASLENNDVTWRGVRNSDTVKRRSTLGFRVLRISRATTPPSIFWPVSWPMLNLETRYVVWDSLNRYGFFVTLHKGPSFL